MRPHRPLLVRVLAVALIVLAASPFTAPFAAHNACEPQHKDAWSDKVADGPALAVAPAAATPDGAHGLRRIEAALQRVGWHQPAPTVLRI